VKDLLRQRLENDDSGVHDYRTHESARLELGCMKAVGLILNQAQAKHWRSGALISGCYTNQDAVPLERSAIALAEVKRVP
jgi:hypothetical protein